jgi:hypothetical protein
MKTSLICIAASLTLSDVNARKHLVDSKGKKLEQTLVKDCNTKCIWQDETNSWCFDSASPNLQIGWTYDQVFDNVDVDEDAGTTLNYFQVTLLPYVQWYGSVHSIFDIERLYYNDLSAELAKSKYELALYLTFNGDGDICPGMGWNHDALKLAISMESHFKECSKIFVNNIGSVEGIWRGEDAKWFETCENSEDVTVDFTTWNFYDSIQNTIYLGTREPISVDHCYRIIDIWPLSYIGSSSSMVNPLDLLTKIALSRLGSYLGLGDSKHFNKSYDLFGHPSE